jgi:trk system potassium uptake protein TrkH
VARGTERMSTTRSEPVSALRTFAPFASRPTSPFRTILGRVLAIIVLAAVAALLLEYGFDPPLLPRGWLNVVEGAAVAVFVVERLSRLWPLTKATARLREAWYDYVLIVAGAATLVAELNLYDVPIRRVGTIYIITLQVILGARFALQLLRLHVAFSAGRLRPGRFVVGSFLSVILIGTLLLSLPTATRPIVAGEKPYQWREHVVNCLFTATSATCVTGLVVYDTGRDFTFGGQVVILVLMQLGGLGIMTLGTVFGLIARRQLSLHESLVVQDSLSHETLGEITRMVRFVCLLTFTCEAIGAILLYGMWTPQDAARSGRLFWSVFHAVSAFCNAGFSLSSSSLVPYRGCWQVYGVIMPAIVIGGLGFPVVHELYRRAAQWTRWRFIRTRYQIRGAVLPTRPKRRRLSLHTKLVLTTTAALIVAGTVVLFVTETPVPWNKQHRVLMNRSIQVDGAPGCMYAMPWPERLAAACFQSVTARTAGFNTALTDEQSLSPAAHYFLCLLMFIGGSPASTAGGIKTVTFAIFAISIFSTLRGRTNAEAFRRTIGLPVIRRAATVVVLMAGLVFLMTFLLCYFESASLRALLFETVSASGTVGLSTGITPGLTRAGKLVIIVTMFAGRVGPLTLLVALTRRTKPVRYDYPEEQPVIG